MSAGFTFLPPPLEKPDFQKEDTFKEWDAFVNATTNQTINDQEDTVGKGKSQYYNPKDGPTDPIKKPVVWNGFPRRLQVEYPNHPEKYYEIADKTGGWPGLQKARNQDEYLEWYVYKNDNDKITRIDFTCESPEYFSTLFAMEPDTCLKVYQTYVSPDVKMEDLTKIGGEGQKEYNTYNKWNTTHGAMHLNCPPNSLGAEIMLAGDATIIRTGANGIITDAQELINCSKYGDARRHSDPHIGSECNALCRAGMQISLANPVCLFIAGVNTSGWTTPDGKDASTFMKMVRGNKEQKKGLRYSLTVPESEGFTVSDIKIGGVGIQYGGQVAEKIEVGLMAEASKNASGANQAYSCVGARKANIPKEHPLLIAYPYLKDHLFLTRHFPGM